MRKTAAQLNLLLVRGALHCNARGLTEKKRPCGLCPDEEEKSRQKALSEKTKTESKLKEHDPLCKHHVALVPDFGNLKDLQKFELKSECSTFHMSSAGNCH